ncbi:ABC transporter permease [Marinicrinis lubricantis]
MYAILAALTILVSVIFYNVSNNDTDWRTSLQNDITANERALEEAMPDSVKQEIQEEVEIAKYQLEHGIAPIDDTLWGGVRNMSALISLITIFTVIIAADAVAAEFTWGTIKLLLIRPVNRTKILLSKFFSSFLFALMMLVFLFVISFIVNGFLYGFGGADTNIVTMNTSGTIEEGSVIAYVLKYYAYSLGSLVMIVTLSFLISSVFRSSSLAIGISMFIYFAGTSIAVFLSRYEWSKFFLFSNMDLTQYLYGEPLVEGMTLGFSLLVLLGYFILFNAISWYVFKKRDVAA